jgi:outer membrane lipoprotein carrier protein
MRPALLRNGIALFVSGLLTTAAPAFADRPAAGFTPPTSAEEAVKAIERHYGGIEDLTAKVVQKNFLKSVGKTQTFTGSLSVKKPGRLRLAYTNGQVVVIDGKVVWFYSRENAQVIRRTFQDFEHANIPVAFLLGAGTVLRDFDVSLAGPEEGGMLELVPKKHGAAMIKLRLLSDDSGRITRMIIYDRSGNTSDLLFTDVHENVGVDDAQFRFKVPKGTEVIDQ